MHGAKWKVFCLFIPSFFLFFLFLKSVFLSVSNFCLLLFFLLLFSLSVSAFVHSLAEVVLLCVVPT